MHIPDGYIDLPTSAGAAVVALGSVGTALRRGAKTLKDRQIPLAALAAAFVFVLQMLNFPVAAGTSGHLLGGTLAVLLLGPSMGITVVAVVIVIQGLVFADGGISALGLNVVNMAVVTALVGWFAFRGLMRLLPRRSGPALGATMVASWLSVVASSMMFSLEYAIGGTGGIDPNLVFRAMVGVHALIGIGEGIITATAVGAVLAVRPDLVYGMRRAGVDRAGAVAPSGRAVGGFVAGALAIGVTLILFVAPFASPSPDGLQKVAADTGFATTEQSHPVGGPLAGYGGSGGGVAKAVAGTVGLGVTFAAGLGVAAVVRRRRRHQTEV